METMGQVRSLVVLGVYWFLAAIAFLFLIAALWQVNRVRTMKPFQVRVLERKVKVEVREIRGKNGRYNALFAVADLRLERTDTRAVVNHTEEFPVSKDDFVSFAFLDSVAPGATRPAEERDTRLSLDPPNPWLIAGALAVCAWLFGAFALIAKSAADGGGMGLRILALALIPAGVMAYGIGAKLMKEKAEQSLQRVPVEGRAKQSLAAEMLNELQGMGVTAGVDVRKFFGDAEETVQFAEYDWQGKKLRTVSRWCQADVCAGRLNPANPRDVKWGAEP